jgi:hypothetical protein
MAKKSVRPVSRALVKAVRHARPPHILMENQMKREAHRSFVISRRNDPKLNALRERYEIEEMAELTAARLYDQYRDAGATWAACVHAAKTDWVAQFHMKWGERLRKLREAEIPV